MLTFIIRRVIASIPVMLGVTMIVFLILRLIPGNPVILSLGTNATPQSVHFLENQLGLNKPLWQQYVTYITGLVHGNLGLSMQSGQPVSTLLSGRLAATLQLAFAAFIVAVISGFSGGLIASRFHKTVIDHVVMIMATILLATPQFWLGILLIMVFALELGWFPVFGYGGLSHLVLPALSVGLIAGAVNVRIIKNEMMAIMHHDYIRTAQAKGASAGRILMAHALRNALLPTITILGLQLGYLLSGTVIVEQLFGWPGLGSLLISAIQSRDYTLVQGGVLYLSLIFIIVNLLVDILYAIIDPRVRYS
ncbi:ABC transporter permease [Sulfobacillus thermosulfidooxidans]|uniref:ABC transporter permease n=1 Tax=Sulfobacillus thermosulfidooxidans TaxID=28034 RepID=UPI000408150C|nr:ABC transporter permease [Sulfobacillus thermosulfidooxidans]